MANTIYVPVGGLSDEVEKFYASVGGLSKEVIKGYCSVGGLSKQFYGSGGGGGGIIFEYAYATNQQYDIHNYLTLEDVIDAVYAKFVEYFSSYGSTYTHIQNFIANWQNIRTDVINALEQSGETIVNVVCEIVANKTNGQTNSYTRMNVRFGDDTFPMTIRLNGGVNTDSYGNQYCTMRTSYSVPQSKNQIIAYAYADSYDLSSLQSYSGNMLRIGYFASSSSSMYSTSLGSFGMKKD